MREIIRTEKSLAPTKQKVRFILETIEGTENCDITLMIEILKFYHPNQLLLDELGNPIGISFEEMYNVPREDHIKRYRAFFNSIGRYITTDKEVAKQRGLSEEKWREEMKKK